LLRIAVAAILGVSALVLCIGWVIRQPNLGSTPFPGALHADPAILEAHVRFLASQDPPRSWRNPSSLARTATYIADSMQRTHARYSEQVYRVPNLDTKNLIAVFGPTTGPRVVIGAHYDVFGDFPGADDNASGVAGLLELARLLDQQTLKSPVELVAYSTEEPPFFGSKYMGSAVHANGLARAGTPVRAMISLEMIGYYQPLQPNLNTLFYLVYPNNGNFIALVGRWADRDLVKEAKKCFRGATDVQAVSYSGPVGLGADLSDQRNYWANGYSAFMVTDTAFMRNMNYHGRGDTADSLDYRRMAGVVDGVLCTAVQLANAG
jgi:hypothetical protein